MKDIQAKLLSWYAQNKREMPWRNTKNPYYIWLSEIILQQTRVAQGLPYYEKFVDQYPTIQLLANASEEEVLKLWQGLGYYSRARNLHASAKYISNELNGKFPNNYNDLLKLKGVGDYTASAISSFCFNEKKAVLDGNVFRFLARLYGVETTINSTAGKKEFSALSTQLLNLIDPATHNQAIMEFGANQCKPKSPDCSVCVFNDRCLALSNRSVNVLPKKDKKITIKNRYFNYVVPVVNKRTTVLKQRTQNGIWKNLYEFPLYETTDLSTKEEVLQFVKKEGENIILDLTCYNSKPIIHKLSHQHIYTVFWILEAKSSPYNDEVEISAIQKLPVSTLISNFIDVFFS